MRSSCTTRCPASGSRSATAIGCAAPPIPTAEGVAIALEVVDELRADVQGVYIIPAFGRYDLAADILDAVGAISLRHQSTRRATKTGISRSVFSWYSA